jgi:hypothetical protein
VYDASFAALARQAQAQARDRHGRHRRGDDGYNNDDDRHQQNSIQHGILLAPIVTHQQRMQWEMFASLEASATATVNASTIAATTAQNDEPLMVRIHSIDTTNTTNPAEHLDYHLPVWQVEPLPNRSSSSTLIGLDLVSHAKIQRVVDQVLVTQRAALAPLLDFDELDQYLPNDDSSNSPTVQSFEQGTRDDVATEVRDQTHSNQQPRALLLQPVFSKLVLEDAAILATTSSNNNSNRTIVAMVVAIFSWQRLWHSVAEAADGMVVVLHSSCGSPDYTYQIHHTGSSDDTSSSLSKDDGTAAWMLGEGDLHEPTFDYLRHHVDFEPFRDMNAIGLTGGTHSGNETDLDESICKVRVPCLSVYA